MDKDKLIQQLMATFVGEIEDHARAINRDLLVLEKDPSGELRDDLLKNLFRTAHSLKGAARSVNLDIIEAACHHMEEVLGAVQEGSRPLGPQFFELLFALADALQDAGRSLREKQPLSRTSLAALFPQLEAARVGARSARPPDARASTVQPEQRAVPESFAGNGIVRLSADKLDALLSRSAELLVLPYRTKARLSDLVGLRDFVMRWQKEWDLMEPPIKKVLRPRGTQDHSVAVHRDVYDKDRVAQAMHHFMQGKQTLKQLERHVGQLLVRFEADQHMLGNTVASLEDEVRRLRMMPFQEACAGLERLVRDLCKVSGKQVDLIVEGGEVELDRSILDEMKAPLFHLVRNAIDHGIELPAQRTAAGKPPAGQVKVSAQLRGAGVEVVVADDGRGLDLEAVREQVRKKGRGEPSEECDLSSLIFLPGVSTAPFITELSGRGIGLDLVKSKVESMHGGVAVSFQGGAGTCFILSLPLTLTTIWAVLVGCAGQVFAIPRANIHQIVRLRPQEIRSIEGREILLLDGLPVPVTSLAGILGYPSNGGKNAGDPIPILIFISGQNRIGFAIDELLAEQEVVVKGLGSRVKRIQNVAGSTVLATGRIVLILNVADLLRHALARSIRVTPRVFVQKAAAPARRRLLVVDDSVTTRSLEKSILQGAGYEVVVAVDGVDAWQVIEKKDIDLVVADVDMPRMDGFALTETIRASKRFRHLPIVLVTALDSEKDKERGMEVGADAYLVKSTFDQTHLLDTIAQLL